MKQIFNLLHHKGVKKYSKNTAWLIGDRIVGMLLGFVVGVWVARYLGPERLGILNYAFALVGLLAPLSTLGLPGIVSRDLVKNETNPNVILSSSFGFRILGGLLLCIIISIYLLITKEDIIYFYLGLIASLQFLIKSSEVIEYYYRAKVKSRNIFISKFIGHILSSLLKISFILLGLGVIYFVSARVSLFLFTALALFYFFKKEKDKISLKNFEFRKGISLLKESWPLIFSGVFAVIYLQVDKIMIEEMLGSYELGQYSVAVKISTLWFFIPININRSILPAFVNAKKKDENLYYKRLNSVFAIMVFISYLIIIPISLFANDIINVLFGAQYIAAGKVLAIHIFSIVFFFIGIGRGLWITNESFFKFDLLSNLGAGILNILLNFILLPKLGILGAAYATVLSYSFTFFFANLFFRPARKIFLMQLKALFLIDLLINLRKIKIN